MWAKRCEMCLALEKAITESSWRIAICHNAQLDLQSSRTRRPLKLSSWLCSRPMAQPSSSWYLSLTNSLASCPENWLLIRWSSASAWCSLDWREEKSISRYSKRCPYASLELCQKISPALFPINLDPVSRLTESHYRLLYDNKLRWIGNIGKIAL